MRRKSFLYGSLDETVDREYDRIRAQLEEQQVRDYFSRLALPRRRDREALFSDPDLGFDE